MRNTWSCVRKANLSVRPRAKLCMRLNGMLAVPLELVNTSQEPEQLDFNNYTGGWNMISLKFKTHGMVSVSYYGVAKLLELRALKGEFCHASFWNATQGFLSLRSWLAIKRKKTSWEILWLKKRNRMTRQAFTRETLIPSSLITEHKDNAAIVWFCILKPLSCPCSVITEPQTIKLKRSELKRFHLLSPDPLVLRAGLLFGGEVYVLVLGFAVLLGLLYRAQRLR